MMDSRQHCTFMNGAAERITGFTLAEVQALDRPLHDVVHHTRPDGSHFPISECPIDRALPQRMQEQGEAVFVHKTGRFYPVAFTASPILEEGVPVGTIIEVRDITEEKRREEERVRLLQETQAAVRVRDEFLSVATHELKTPLTPLQLRLTSLKEAASQEPQGMISAARVIRDTEIAQRQVRRLANLVEGLLDVSRLSTGRLQLHLTDVDLSDVTREMLSQLQLQAQTAGCEVRLEADNPVVGLWDRLRLEQVVTNLLTNAFKYGAGKPVHIRVWEESGRARLRVRDEGIGIEPGQESRIFGMFERAVSERHYGGLGLGLYISEQILQALGGTIRVESQPGQGATFCVELLQRPPAS
jgi:PAS domain S-box-containing protein